MKRFRTILFFVVSLLGLVVFTMLFINSSDVIEAESLPVTSFTGSGTDVVASSEIIDEEGVWVMPDYSPADSYTGKPVSVDLIEAHLLIGDTLYDSACFEQTWPQNCEIASLPSSYVTLDGMLYDAECLAQTWPQACQIRMTVSR